MICACGCGADVVQKPRGRGKIYASIECSRRAYQRRRNANPSPDRIEARRETYAKYNAERKKKEMKKRRNREACKRYRDSIKELPKVKA